MVESLVQATNIKKQELLSDSFFREEVPKQVALLVRQFGMDKLHIAEDAVQEAFLRALKTWPYYGFPSNPSGWLAQTAKNIAIDALRREANFKSKQQKVADSADLWSASKSDYEEFEDEHLIQDSTLRLIFACCHPSLSQESQMALALKTLCGLSSAEIANAFLVPVSTIEKRLYRAKEKLKDEEFSIDFDETAEFDKRFQSALHTIYLLEQ